MPTTDKPFSINLWGSHPDLENDDCWTGDNYGTLEEAEEALADPWAPGRFNAGYYASDTAFLELDGPGVNRVILNPRFVPRPSPRAERSEAQYQAAMAHGVQGWNDYEGC